MTSCNREPVQGNNSHVPPPRNALAEGRCIRGDVYRAGGSIVVRCIVTGGNCVSRFMVLRRGEISKIKIFTSDCMSDAIQLVAMRATHKMP
jgi:hypothetical protein